MNGELHLVGSQVEGQPGRVSHGKRVVELRRKSVEVWCKGDSGGGTVGNKEGDGASLVDFGSDREGEGTVSMSEDARGDVWECGSYEGALVMFRGGRARSVELSLCRGE